MEPTETPEPTETLVIDSPDFQFTGPICIDKFEAFKDSVSQKIEEIVTPCWKAQALAKPVMGNVDTVTKVLSEITPLYARMWTSQEVYQKLMDNGTLKWPDDNGILFEGSINFWQGMSYRLGALTCLDEFDGVIIAEPIPTAFDLKLDTVQNSPDKIRFRATLKWGMPPTTGILHCIQFSDKEIL